jgi:hypothetical protein
MTDLANAIAFATTHCLKWTKVSTFEMVQGTQICDYDSLAGFNTNSVADLSRVLEHFFGNSYFIQVNRGTSSLFHWRVIVGW